jgi:hypothetical protein
LQAKKILLKTMFDFIFVNARVVLKGLSSEIFWLKVVSIVRSLLKGEAPRFSTVFNYLLSFERLFKFPRQLVEPLGIDNIIAISGLSIHSAILKLTRTGTRTETQTRTGTGTPTQT